MRKDSPFASDKAEQSKTILSVAIRPRDEIYTVLPYRVSAPSGSYGVGKDLLFSPSCQRSAPNAGLTQLRIEDVAAIAGLQRTPAPVKRKLRHLAAIGADSPHLEIA